MAMVYHGYAMAMDTMLWKIVMTMTRQLALLAHKHIIVLWFFDLLYRSSQTPQLGSS